MEQAAMQTQPEQLELEEVLSCLQRIEGALDQLLKREQTKDWYSIGEFAAIVRKAPFTCREYARLGRIRSEKRTSGRGKFQEWVISHEELLRYQRHGLLPIHSGCNGNRSRT